MSIAIITEVFQNIETCTQWSLQLLNIVSTKKDGIGYSCRQIELSPSSKLPELLKEISGIYLHGKKKAISLYQDVREYDGTANSLTVYKLQADSELIANEFNALLEAIANPDTESDPFSYNSAYLLKGILTLDENEVPLKLISMQNPVTTLKNKFAHNHGKFYEISDKVLSLRPTMDVLILDKSIYFLSLAGENLFNMARSYKKVCHDKVEQIEQSAIVTDTEIFKGVAESGHNPRKFVAFNEKRLTALKNKNTRNSIAKKFSIPLDAETGKFDTSVDGASEKIVKLLCNKGMLDPFDKDAVEVDGARQWK